MSAPEVCTATGEGVTRAPVNRDYVTVPVWRDAEGQWWQAHPTDPRRGAVRWDGEVRNVVETRV